MMSGDAHHDRAHTTFRRSVLVMLLLLTAVHLALNVVYLSQLRDTPFWDRLVLDEEAYHIKAMRIIDEGWIGDGIFYQAPLYPYFLAAVYRTVGPNPTVIRWAQVGISTATLWILFLIGYRLFGRRVGLACSALFVLYGVATFYNGLALKVTLSIFGTSLFLWALLGTDRFPSGRRLFAAGVLAGINAAFRGNFLLMIPGAALWILIAAPRRSKGRGVAIFLFGALVLLGPIAARN